MLTRALATYVDRFSHSWRDDAPIDAVRFVVLDCETTGLDPRHHRIVSIGAVGMRDGQIDLGDTYEALLRVRHNTAATLVHGITRAESRTGLSEPEALAGLLAYLGDGVIVGHHIRYDLAMIQSALTRHASAAADAVLYNRRIDTADLTRRLAADGAFSDGSAPSDLSLDGLCAHFDIVTDPDGAVHGADVAGNDSALTHRDAAVDRRCTVRGRTGFDSYALVDRCARR